MIIDIHAHTSDHKMIGLHTEDASINSLVSYSKKYEIDKIVLLATYFPFKKSGTTNKKLLDKICGNDLFIPFGSLDVTNNFRSGLKELEELLEAELINGIKLYPGYQKFSVSDPTVYPLFDLARKYTVPVMIHSGELHHCCPKEQRLYKCGGICWIDSLGYLAHPQNMVGAFQKFDDVVFVISHLGNPYFGETKKILFNYENVYTDISGQFLSRTPESTTEYKIEIKNVILDILNTVPGAIERILFGTDFPIQSYSDSISIVKSLKLSLEYEELIFHLNAAKILKQ